jgi:integrase/recombinase XerD
MPGDLERLPVPGSGPAVLAAELIGRIRAELPMIGGLGEREQVLVAAWLTGLRSARTRRAYAGDAMAWLGWLAERDTDVLAAGRVHVALWAATWLDAGAAASSVRRRLSALSSFYRYCAAHDLTGRVPTQGVARPVVDPDFTATVGLDRDQARALVAAADADTGPQALRTAAVIRLLLHNALRVDEACAAGIADLGEDSGHRVLRVVRKGARKAKIPLTPATMAALEAYLADRAQQAGVASWRQLDGPLLATATGGRLRQGHLRELVRRPGPHRRDRRVGAALSAQPAPLGDHLRPGRRGRPARRAGLRRPQGPPHHPTYQAMLEVGRAQRTIFVARYLPSRELQREITEGLNVVEAFNGANSVIYYGKGGEIASNSRDEQEMTVLCLRILQAALVYVNTLMLQDVLAEDDWAELLTPEDRRGLTPLFWQHVLPYGEVKLDMTARLSIRTPTPASGP